jgi:hypothetical protein
MKKIPTGPSSKEERVGMESSRGYGYLVAQTAVTPHLI